MKSRSRRFRYTLQTLVAFIAVAVLLLAVVRPLRDWLDSTPLAVAVLRMNADVRKTVQSTGGPVTEEKVLAAIESELSRGNMPIRVQATLERIARSRRLPSDCSLEKRVYYKGEQIIECQVVELRIPTGPNTGFRLHICDIETANPNGAKSIHEAFD